MDSGEIWEEELITQILASRECIVHSSKSQEHLPLSNRKLTYTEFIELLKSKPYEVGPLLTFLIAFRMYRNLFISQR